MSRLAGCLTGIGIVFVGFIVFTRWAWLPLAAAGAAAAVWAALWPLRRRERKLLQRWMDDQCVRCGYELRGIGRAGQCPECGTPFDGVDPTIRRDAEETPNSGEEYEDSR